MKIFITGIAGAIGSHLAEALVAQGHAVSGIDSFETFYDPRIKEMTAGELMQKGIRIERGNLLAAPLEELLEGVEVIVHLAAQPGISASTQFTDYYKNNVDATERLLIAAEKTHSLKHFIYGSTSSVYGAMATGSEETVVEPTSHYGISKLAGEQITLMRFRKNKFPATSLRFFSVYGERERPEKFFHKLIRAILNNEPMPFYTGSDAHVRSYTYVGDIVQGIIAAIEHRDAVVGEIINLGTDTTSTTGEAMRIVEDILGARAQISSLPPRDGDQKETRANIAKARALLNWQPTTSLRDGLAREVEWYKEKIHGKI